MKLLRRLTHWVLAPTHHEHLYEYHALRNEQGAVRFFWRCTFIFCDREIIDEEGYLDD